MKAITLWQPYPALIAIGAKGFETRSWYTNYRGPVAIHAAKKSVLSVLRLLPDEVVSIICETVETIDIMDGYAICAVNLEDLPTGCVTCTVDLVDCIKITPSFVREVIGVDSKESLFGDYTPGRYAWKLENINVLPEPVPAIGRQGFWNWTGAEYGTT